MPFTTASIAEIARNMPVKIPTFRFYEQSDLVSPLCRTEGSSYLS